MFCLSMTSKMSTFALNFTYTYTIEGSNEVKYHFQKVRQVVIVVINFIVINFVVIITVIVVIVTVYEKWTNILNILPTSRASISMEGKNTNYK